MNIGSFKTATGRIFKKLSLNCHVTCKRVNPNDKDKKQNLLYVGEKKGRENLLEIKHKIRVYISDKKYILFKPIIKKLKKPYHM